MTAPSRFRGRDLVQIERMCAGKTRYPDELTARAAGQHYQGRDRMATKKLYVYKCPHCAGHHLTRAQHAERAAVDWKFSTPTR